MENILTALGGVGLCLLDMIALTEGLQGLAGYSLRRAHSRSALTPSFGTDTRPVVVLHLSWQNEFDL